MIRADLPPLKRALLAMAEFFVVFRSSKIAGGRA